MKAIKLIIFALCMAVGVNSAFAQKATKEAEVTFKTDITCNKCKQKIEKNIPFEKGVKDVTVNVEKKEVKVKFSTDKTDKAKLKKSIEKLGYTCEEVTADVAATKTAAKSCGESCGKSASCASEKK